MKRKTSMIESRRNAGEMRSIPLAMAGIPLQLCTDSAALAEIAAGFFPAAEFETARQARANLTMFVRKRRDISHPGDNFPIFRGRDKYVHADYGSDGSVWFDLNARAVSGIVSEDLIADADLLRRTVLAVIAGVLAPSLGLVGLHAGCVVRNGKAVLLAAASGVGKSTLTLALALQGWSLLADDWTFVANSPTGLRAWGMLTALKLLPDAVSYFPALAALSPAMALNGEMSFEVDPWNFFRVDRAIDAAPASLVLLERGPCACCRSHSHIKRCEPEEMQTALLREIEEQPVGVDGRNDNESSMIEQLCTLPCFKVRINGDPAAIAADLSSILTEQVCA
jgi:hypothetical protein